MRPALTGMVWLPCRLLMAACASAWLPYFTKAQPAGRAGARESWGLWGLPGWQLPSPSSLLPTFAGSVGPAEDGALLDLAEGLKEAPDVVLALLLPQHAHEELPVF